MRILTLIMALLASVVGNAIFAQDQEIAYANLMRLDPYYRALTLIRHYESWHPLSAYPTICWGHVVKKGERLPKRQYSKAEGEALLQKDFRHLCAYYSYLGKDSIIAAACAYNVGPANVDKSTFLRKLKSGDRNIYADYTKLCRYKGRPHPGIHRRRWMELKLLYDP